MYLENQFIYHNKMLKRIFFKTISIVVITTHLSVTPFNGFSFKEIANNKNIGHFIKGFAFLIDDFFVKKCYAQGEFEPPDSASFQSGALKNFQANLFTGSAGFSVPINVLSGRNGLQSEISINYSSSSGNGWCGVGWNLDIPSITRSTKRGVPKYDSTDTFIYNSNNAQAELVSIGGNEYRTKIEGGFLKFGFDGTSWQVIDKTGGKYLFGSSSDSRQANSSGTFRWCMDKVIDLQGSNLNGNYMIVSYLKDEGQIYPQQIQYTGNEDLGELPHQTIDFILETRTDTLLSYITGSSVVTTYRLKEIDIKGEGNRVRRYTLNYTYSNKTARSLLTSVIQYGADGQTSLSPSTFTYEENDYIITPASSWISGFGVGSAAILGDFNSDALTDAFAIEDNVSKVALSNGVSFTSPDIWSNPSISGSPGDLNGDGITDLVGPIVTNVEWGPSQLYLIIYYRWRVGISDRTTFNDAGYWSGEYIFYSNEGPPAPFAGDFNGDSLIDVGEIRNSWEVMLCNGTSFSGKKSWLGSELGSGTPFSGDFNGDGLTDVGMFNNGTWKVAFSNGSSFIPDGTWLSGFGNSDDRILSLDVNNDGLTDIVLFDEDVGNWQIALSNGTEFVPSGDWINGFGANKLPLAGDFNGNGIIGPGYFDKDTGNWQITDTQGALNDLLIQINNGIGGTIDISYAPSPHNTSLPFVVQTLSSITVDDGLGNSYTTNYTYSDGLYDAEDREPRGFGYVKVTDAEGNYIETEFLQDDIFKGRIQEQRSFDLQGNLYNKSVNTWQSTNLYPGVDFVYLTKIDNYTYDGDATGRRTQTQFSYDSYGNISQTIELGEVDLDTGNDIGTDKRSAFTEYTYNTSDWLLEFPKHIYVQDQDGNTVKASWFYYDNNLSFHDPPLRGNLTKQENWLDGGLNSVITFSYDDYGNIHTMTDANNHTITTTYDSSYHMFPVTTTNALGHEAISEYYGVDEIPLDDGQGFHGLLGQVKSAIDPNGQTTYYIYDTLGRLIKIIGPNDNLTYPWIEYEYDLTTCPIKITKRTIVSPQTSDYLISYTFFDGISRPVEVKTEAEDSTKQILSGIVKYDHRSLAVKQYLPYFIDKTSTYTQPDYDTQPYAEFEYDSLGRSVKVINPDTTFSTTQYDDWTVTQTDENGDYVVRTSDAYGRLIEVKEYNDVQLYTTTYRYDCLSNLKEVVDDHGNVTQISYDSLGRKTEMTDPDMGHWTYEYDEVGNLTNQTDAKGQTITFEYDSLNRLTNKLTNGQTAVTYQYDDTTRSYSKGGLSTVQDESGQTDFYYDNLGREIKTVKTISGTFYTVHRAYDALDRLTNVTYPDGEVVNYTYNKVAGIETVYSNFEGLTTNHVTNVNYNALGQMTYIEYDNGTYTNYTYDALTTRLTNLKTNGGSLQDLTYTFDNVGNVSRIEDAVNTATQDFVYDDLNRLVQASGSYGTLDYEYDSIGNLTQKNSIVYTYGLPDGSKPHAVTNYGGIEITYDANGNMQTKGNTQFSYNYDNRLTRVEGASSSTNVEVNIDLQFGWNFVSIPVILEDNSISNVLSSIAGQYDQVSRFNPDTDTFENYINDPNYDQFTSIEYGEGYQIYVTNPLGCNLTVIGDIPQEATVLLMSDWNLIANPSLESKPVEEVLTGLIFGSDYDRVSRYNSSTGLFENYPGELTHLGKGEAYYIHCLHDTTWNITNSTEITEFVYDGDGGRVKKITPNGTTIYIGSLYEINGSLTKKHIFLGSNRIVSVESTGERYYYHSDHIGSSNIITDSTGSQAQLLEYYPFGETKLNQGSDITNYKFTGKELDASTELYYYGARYYDAELGRFISADMYVQDSSNPQNFNRYTYCFNNPLNYIDPTGHFGFLAALAFIAKVAATVSAVSTVAAIATGSKTWANIAQISGYVALAAGVAHFAGTAIQAWNTPSYTQLAAVDLGRIRIPSPKSPLTIAWGASKGPLVAAAIGAVTNAAITVGSGLRNVYNIAQGTSSSRFSRFTWNWGPKNWTWQTFHGNNVLMARHNEDFQSYYHRFRYANPYQFALSESLSGWGLASALTTGGISGSISAVEALTVDAANNAFRSVAYSRNFVSITGSASRKMLLNQASSGFAAASKISLLTTEATLVYRLGLKLNAWLSWRLTR